MKFFRFLSFLSLSAVLSSLSAATAYSADHGVILLYHHVSEDTPASTSVSPVQFRHHLQYLEDNQYQVLSLSQMLATIYAGRPVAENAVAITFDDAYESVYRQAFPELRKRGWPFTVFVADEAVDRHYRHMMSWEQMMEMARKGAEFGGHSVTHAYLVRHKPGEAESQWQKRVKAEIVNNIERIEAKLQTRVTSFAYPYGEYNEVIQRMVGKLGLYGLAQQSGAVSAGVSPQQIPRFPMAEGFSGMQRFATALNTRPLPVLKAEGGPIVRAVGEPRETLHLRLAPGSYRPEQLACYSARGDRLPLSRDNLDFEVQAPPWQPGRNKVNCTAPSATTGGEYFWYSHLWLVKKTKGEW